MAGLSAKRQAFVEHYFIERFNQTKAAIRAGYSERSAHVTASRLLKNAKVLEAIQERMAGLKMSADEVIINLTEQGRSSMADFVSLGGRKEDKPFIDLKKALMNDKLHLVKKLKITEKHGNTTEYTTEIELYDKQAANHLLGKHHRLFAEKIEVDWTTELMKAGLDPMAEERLLVEQFKRHLLSGGSQPDGVGTSEGPAASRDGKTE